MKLSDLIRDLEGPTGVRHAAIHPAIRELREQLPLLREKLHIGDGLIKWEEQRIGGYFDIEPGWTIEQRCTAGTMWWNFLIDHSPMIEATDQELAL